MQVSESSSDSSQSFNSSSLDVSARVGVLENAVLEMRKDVRSLDSMQSLLHSEQGMRLNVPLSSEQNLPPRVPSFVTVSSAGSSIPIFSAQSSANQLLLHEGGTSASIATPSLVLPKDWLGFTSKLFMTQAGSSSLSVAGALPPIPNYLVQMVSKDLFIELVLLRPCNLVQLPQVEPVDAQLIKLVKCEKNSSMQPIRSFLDWAEAWCVYASIMFHVKRDRLGDLLSHFLVIAKMSRDTSHFGMGWLDYDRLFRLKAAGNPNVSGGEYDVSLYLGHFFKKSGFQETKPPNSASMDGRNICLKWNKSICDFHPCCYRHICTGCNGNHPFKTCKYSGFAKSDSVDSGSKRPRSLSPPLKSKKHK